MLKNDISSYCKQKPTWKLNCRKIDLCQNNPRFLKNVVRVDVLIFRQPASNIGFMMQNVLSEPFCLLVIQHVA
ncbi:hypothetical protein HK13_08860 [Acetobacter indonesiensis]|nr:hypothetical protein HK13_08860 [Acetobacter indonesiensis]